MLISCDNIINKAGQHEQACTITCDHCIDGQITVTEENQLNLVDILKKSGWKTLLEEEYVLFQKHKCPDCIEVENVDS